MNKFLVWCFCLLSLSGALCLESAHAGLKVGGLSLGKQLQPKKIALIVGIDRSVKSAFWSPLKYAKRDAQRMTKKLRASARFDRIILLDRAENTTKKALLQALQRLFRLVSSSEDTVLVYISAHGSVSKGRKRYIVTSDTTRHLAKTGLAVAKIRKLLRRLRSRKIGLILATCYNGMPGSKAVRTPGTKGGFRPARPLKAERAIQILSAASFAQPAFESSALRSDVYTHYFLDCFKRTKKKTIIRIHICATILTTKYVQKWNGEVQVPKAYSELGANRDFFLVDTKKERRKVGYLRAAWGKKTGKKFQIFRVGRKSAAQRTVHAMSDEVTALLPGRYRVVVTDTAGRALHEQHLVIQDGEVIGLHSPWGLEFQAGAWGSTGVLKEQGDLSAVALVGLRHRYVALMLGIWGTMLSFERAWYTQLAFELRAEAGFRWRRGKAELFAGGFLSGGLLLQDLAVVQSADDKRTLGAITRPVGILRAGITLLPAWKLSQHATLLLGLDLGMVPGFVEDAFRMSWYFAARLGFRWQFGHGV